MKKKTPQWAWGGSWPMCNGDKKELAQCVRTGTVEGVNWHEWRGKRANICCQQSGGIQADIPLAYLHTLSCICTLHACCYLKTYVCVRVCWRMITPGSGVNNKHRCFDFLCSCFRTDLCPWPSSFIIILYFSFTLRNKNFNTYFNTWSYFLDSFMRGLNHAGWQVVCRCFP